MLIDAHAHVFPNHSGASGYQDAETHLAMQQTWIEKFWGKMLTNTLDRQYIPHAGEQVNFRCGKYGRYHWSKNGKDCWLQRFPFIMEEMEWKPEQMIAAMDATGVEKAVLQAGYMESNYCTQYFAECIKKWPDRFIGTIDLDYDITRSRDYRENELEKLKTATVDLGMRGVFQGYPREQNIDDDEFLPFWKTFARLGIPHIFWVGFQPKAEYLDSLNRIEKVLKKHPDVIGVIGHLGGNIRPEGDPDYTATPNELLDILRLPNAYFEVGYVLAYENRDIWKENYEYPYVLHTQVIKRVYEEVGAERLLWGSDMPFTYRTCTYQQCLDLVRLHFDFLSAEEKNLVLGGNAARLFLGQ